MATDTAEVDKALLAKLLADSTLTSLMTDGIYFDVAPQGAKNFVIISQMSHEDSYDLGGQAYERILYLVKAVGQATNVTNVKTAAARIQTLLQDGTLNATGYLLMYMRRSERVAKPEVDQDSDLRWQHRGGLYDVWVQPS